MSASTVAKIFLALILCVLMSTYVYSVTFQTTTMITFIKGKVEVQKGGQGPWVEGFRKMPLEPGDYVRTLEESKAEVALANSSVIRMSESTQIEIPKSEKNTAEKASNVTMSFGMIWAKAQKGDNSLEVKTPMGIAGVRGTTFTLDVNQITKEEELGCIEGRVWGNYGGVMREIGAAQALKFANGMANVIPFDVNKAVNRFSENGFQSDDDKAPELGLTEPKSGEKITSDKLTIKGFAQDNKIVRKINAFVNGQKVEVPITAAKRVEFSFNAELKYGQENRIEIEAYDDASNAGKMAFNIDLKAETKLELKSPKNEEMFKSGSVKIEGTLSDSTANQIRITLDGKAETITVTSKTFTKEYAVDTLTAGDHDLKVELIFQNKVIDSKSAKFKVEKEGQAMIQLSSPSDNEKIAQDFIIKGTVSGHPEGAKISVSYGSAKTEADLSESGAFEVNAAFSSLADGSNTIIIDVLDKEGNKLVTKTVSVTVGEGTDSTEPQINLTSPPTGSLGTEYLIKGTAMNMPEMGKVRVGFNGAVSEIAPDPSGNFERPVPPADQKMGENDILTEIVDKDNKVVFSATYKVTFSSGGDQPFINLPPPPPVNPGQQFSIKGTVMNFPEDGIVVVEFNGDAKDIVPGPDGNFERIVAADLVKVGEANVLVDVLDSSDTVVASASFKMNIGAAEGTASAKPIVSIVSPPTALLGEDYILKGTIINFPPGGKVGVIVNGTPAEIVPDPSGNFELTVPASAVRAGDNSVAVDVFGPLGVKLFTFNGKFTASATAVMLNVISPAGGVYFGDVQVSGMVLNAKDGMIVRGTLNGTLSQDFQLEPGGAFGDIIPFEELIDGENKVDIAVFDGAARVAYKTVTFTKGAATVVVTVSKPVDYSYLSGTEFELAGTIDGTIAKLSVRIAGGENTYDFKTGAFSYMIPLPAGIYGEQNLSIKAYNSANAQVGGKDMIVVLTKPVAGKVEVVVGANPPILIDVINGAFKAEVPIRKGDNVIKVRPPVGESGTITLTSPLDGAFGDPTRIEGMLIDSGGTSAGEERRDFSPPDLIVETVIGFGDPTRIAGMVIDNAENPYNPVRIRAGADDRTIEAINGAFSEDLALYGETNQIIVEAYDAAGNLSRQTILKDSDAPIVTMIRPIKGTTYTASDVGLNITDNKDGTFSMNVEGLIIDICDNPLTIISYTTSKGSAYTDLDINNQNFTFSVPVVKGANFLRIEVEDAAGNIGFQDIDYFFIPDSLAPVITVSTPASGTKYTTPAIILVSGTIQESFLNTFSITITNDYGTYSQTLEPSYTAAAGIVTFAETLYLGDLGNYSIKIVATDADNRVAERIINVSVEAPAHPPGVPSINLDNNGGNIGEFDF